MWCRTSAGAHYPTQKVDHPKLSEVPKLRMSASQMFLTSTQIKCQGEGLGGTETIPLDVKCHTVRQEL